MMYKSGRIPLLMKKGNASSEFIHTFREKGNNSEKDHSDKTYNATHDSGIPTMKHFHLTFILTALGLLSATSLRAQSDATRGVIEGTVRSENGSVLPAVLVTITNQ